MGTLMDLFEHMEGDSRGLPLAARMRPRTLDEVEGQDHILGPGRLLRRAIEADRVQSIILYGPPGSGKTSLADVMARVTRRNFARTSGVAANVQILREMLETARMKRSAEGRGTILFIDEIHRFNKAQQDVLLPYVEEGAITLVGATTHNPMFFINAPLTSRSLMFELKPLSKDALMRIMRRALVDPRGFGGMKIEPEPGALEHIAEVCEGDARRALNALEIAVLTSASAGDGSIRLTRRTAEESVQKKAVLYDHDEDGHYDTISAFIKSVRGSDPHAAVYWLAKMLYAGEDPRFIARRLVILASEDIGNADPRGLLMATAAMEAAEFVGMPEARIILAQAATYLATAPKSNASYLAIEKAMSDVEQGRTQQVPERLKNIRVRKDGQSGAGDDAYRYPHDYEGHFIMQEYLSESGARYYEPSHEGYEETIARRMAAWEERCKEQKRSEGLRDGRKHDGDK